jgi:peptidoglycan pentaglycine glycine transferase (the first glycine)
VRQATKAEIADWNALVLANPDGGEILQSKDWARFKERHDWKPHYLVFDELPLAALCLSRRVPGLGELWYCPKGPGVKSVDELNQIGKAIKAARPKAFAVKAEPEISINLGIDGWVKAPFDIHISQATYVVNLKHTPDELLASFKQKTRYNIRLAEKHGVLAYPVPATEEFCQKLYELLEATQRRAGFVIRSKDYCFDYWKTLSEAGQGQIFLADHDGQTVAGVFVQILGEKAWYKDGGSRREASSVMAPYLTQWEVMKWLKDRGVTSYDLLGAPRQGDETSPLKGLVQFKSGFGGEFKEFIGTYDLPLQGLKYWLWRRLLERLTLAYHTRIKHNLWY